MSSRDTEGFGPGIFVGFLITAALVFITLVAYGAGESDGSAAVRDDHYFLTPEQFAQKHPKGTQ